MTTGISGYLQGLGDAFEERLGISKVVPPTLERDVDDPRRERALAEGPPPIDEIRSVDDDDRVRRLRVVARGSVAVHAEYGRIGWKPESIASVGSRGVVVSSSVIHTSSEAPSNVLSHAPTASGRCPAPLLYTHAFWYLNCSTE